MRKLELSVLVEKDNESGLYVGQIEEYPAVMSQGTTIEELKENLKDALRLYLDTQKQEIQKTNANRKIFKRKLIFII